MMERSLTGPSVLQERVMHGYVFFSSAHQQQYKLRRQRVWLIMEFFLCVISHHPIRNRNRCRLLHGG